MVFVVFELVQQLVRLAQLTRAVAGRQFKRLCEVVVQKRFVCAESTTKNINSPTPTQRTPRAHNGRGSATFSQCMARPFSRLIHRLQHCPIT